MDCFTREEPFSFYFMIVAALFVLLHLATVIPIIIFVVRNQVRKHLRSESYIFLGVGTLLGRRCQAKMGVLGLQLNTNVFHAARSSVERVPFNSSGN